jgi:hypothetical protein
MSQPTEAEIKKYGKKSAWVLIALFTILIPEALAGEKYPLTMTAVYTRGHIRPDSGSDRKYTSGDGEYECTSGDATHGPDCKTITEWAQLDSIGGTPDTVLFTMADGVQIGVQAPSVNKVYDTTCTPGTSIIFCDLYYSLMGKTQAPIQKAGPFGQTVFMTSQEQEAARVALDKELFGNGNEMRVSIRYKLQGKPDKTGFQRIEVEGVDSSTTHILNPLGDGYSIKK